MPRRRPVFYDPWIANLTAEIEIAAISRLSAGQLAGYLDFYRAGCNCSRLILIEGLRHLIYEVPEEIDLERLASDIDGLERAVDRLRLNKTGRNQTGARLAAEDVEDFVRSEIKRSYFRYRREESSNLRPSPSTRSHRKARLLKQRAAEAAARGEHFDPSKVKFDPQELGELKRSWSLNTVSGLASETLDRDGVATTWLDARTHNRRLLNLDISESDLRDHVARTPEEMAILDCLTSQMNFREIAEHLGISKYRVETTVHLFRRRASEE